MQLTRLPRDTEPQRGYHKHTSRTFRGGQYRGSRKTRPLVDSALFLPAIKPTHPLTPTPAAPSRTPNIYYDFKPSGEQSSYGAPVAEPISDSYGNPATPVYVGSTTPVYVAASTSPGPISYVTSSPQPSYVGDTVKTTAIYRSETGKKFQPGTVYQEPKKV